MRKLSTRRMSSRISSRSRLLVVGRPVATRTSRTDPTATGPGLPPPPPSTSMRRQLQMKSLYACGRSKRRASEHTAATGAVIDCTTDEQHWLGPAACSRCRATSASNTAHDGPCDADATLFAPSPPPVVCHTAVLLPEPPRSCVRHCCLIALLLSVCRTQTHPTPPQEWRRPRQSPPPPPPRPDLLVWLFSASMAPGPPWRTEASTTGGHGPARYLRTVGRRRRSAGTTGPWLPRVRAEASALRDLPASLSRPLIACKIPWPYSSDRATFAFTNSSDESFYLPRDYSSGCSLESDRTWHRR